jgi:hypothetical protein
MAALAVFRSKTTYVAVKYHRVQAHAGALRAVVALQPTLLVIVWNMLHDGVAYDELGIDHYDKTNWLPKEGCALRVSPATADLPGGRAIPGPL